MTTATSLITESRLQSDCYQWHHNTYPAQRGQLFMVYNTPKNAAHGAILKAMGMVAGAPDLVYLGSERRVIFLECKLPGGIQSPAQKAFQKQVEALGHTYKIFRSLEEFKAIINS